METVKKPTFREIALSGLEQINGLCLDQAWLASRKKILELTHEMVQRLSVLEDNSVELSDDNLRDILTALRFVQFSAKETTAFWEPLVTKLTEIANRREGAGSS